MGKKMNNAPVFFTVVQVRFNPILDLEGYLPSIQGKFRALHFPDFKRETVHRLVLPFGAGESGQVPAPSFQPQARCIFGNINGTSSFVMENNALSLQTTAYETFETFSETYIKGLSIIHEVLNLDFSERIGLRYLDAVLPKSNESLSDYLIPEVLGLSQKLEGRIHSISETVATTSAGHLKSHVAIQEGQLGLPQELVSLAPKIANRFDEYNGIHAIIDTDAFKHQRQAFSLDDLENTLKVQHDAIWVSFEEIVTEYALQVWE